MIGIFSGDIFSLEADLIAVTVNTVGAMGKGIALTARERWPSVNRRYRAICLSSGGKDLAFERFPVIINPDEEPSKGALLIATKRDWRDGARLEDVVVQIGKTVNLIERRFADGPSATIALPPLGCGLGGLDWAVVRPLMASAFAPSRHNYLMPDAA